MVHSIMYNISNVVRFVVLDKNNKVLCGKTLRNTLLEDIVREGIKMAASLVKAGHVLHVYGFENDIRLTYHAVNVDTKNEWH